MFFPSTASFVQILFFFCLLKSSVSAHPYLTLSEDEKTVTGISSIYSGPVEIPAGVEVIGDSAFRDNRRITSIKFPSSLKQIGQFSFFNCSTLTGSLVIPDSVTSIESNAFFYCSGFTISLTIGNNVTNMGSSAFFGCSGFTGSLYIPNNVTNIGIYAFYGCIGFTGSLTIGNNVTNIRNSAFSSCSGFTGSLSIPNSVAWIEYGAFINCSGFTGSLVIPNSVTSIGTSAFSSCSGFTGSLTIPILLADLDYYVFQFCSGLTEVHFKESLRFIGDFAFEGCSSLKVCYFKSREVSFSSRAFIDTPKLTLFVEQNKCADFKVEGKSYQGSQFLTKVECVVPALEPTNTFTLGDSYSGDIIMIIPLISPFITHM